MTYKLPGKEEKRRKTEYNICRTEDGSGIVSKTRTARRKQGVSKKENRKANQRIEKNKK